MKSPLEGLKITLYGADYTFEFDNGWYGVRCDGQLLKATDLMPEPDIQDDPLHFLREEPRTEIDAICYHLGQPSCVDHLTYAQGKAVVAWCDDGRKQLAV